MWVKFLFFIVCLIGLASSAQGDGNDEMKKMMGMVHAACIKEAGTSEEVVMKAINKEFTDDPNLKCYIKCILSQTSILDEETGEIDLDVFIGSMPDEMKPHMGPLRENCANVVGADLCDKCFNLLQCFAKAVPDHFLFF